MFDLVVSGDLVLPDRVLSGGHLAVSGGTIRAVGVGAPPAAKTAVETGGKLVFPGVVDGQVHAGSAAGIEGLGDASVAAAAGGVTTIVDMPFDEPHPVNSVERLERKVEAIERLAVVDVALYAAPRKGAGPEGLVEMAEAGACAFKVSTYEYHPVRFPGYDAGELFEIFPVIAETGLPVAFHNEEPSIVRRLTDRFERERRNTPEAHGASRPLIAELAANVAVFEIARTTGVRCHIVHSSLARGFDHVRWYREEGVRVSAETCVQYLVFDEDDVLRLGARLKQNPPIRSADEKEALWGKVTADEVDFVSSDHVRVAALAQVRSGHLQERLGSPGARDAVRGALYRRGDRTCDVAGSGGRASLGGTGAALRAPSPQGRSDPGSRRGLHRGRRRSLDLRCRRHGLGGEVEPLRRDAFRSAGSKPPMCAGARCLPRAGSSRLRAAARSSAPRDCISVSTAGNAP